MQAHERSPVTMSRGKVVTDFLDGGAAPEEYVRHLSATDDRTPGYNVVVGNLRSGALWAHSNRGPHWQRTVHLGSGRHAIGNGLLAETWPKMRKGLDGLGASLAKTRAHAGTASDCSASRSGLQQRHQKPIAGCN